MALVTLGYTTVAGWPMILRPFICLKQYTRAPTGHSTTAAATNATNPSVGPTTLHRQGLLLVPHSTQIGTPIPTIFNQKLVIKWEFWEIKKYTAQLFVLKFKIVFLKFIMFGWFLFRAVMCYCYVSADEVLLVHVLVFASVYWHVFCLFYFFVTLCVPQVPTLDMMGVINIISFFEVKNIFVVIWWFFFM